MSIDQVIQILRRTDQQATAGQSVAERHPLRKSNGPRKRAANDERSGKSMDSSRTACEMGEGESPEEEIDCDEDLLQSLDSIT
jgi:hypothetical protein